MIHPKDNCPLCKSKEKSEAEAFSQDVRRSRSSIPGSEDTFTLSEKAEGFGITEDFEFEKHYYKEEDVKEFIKRVKHALKHGLKHKGNPIIRNEWVIIDRLAGDELI